MLSLPTDLNGKPPLQTSIVKPMRRIKSVSPSARNLGVINSNSSRDGHQPVTNRDLQEVFVLLPSFDHSPVHHPLILVKTPKRLYSSTSQSDICYMAHVTKPILFGYGRPRASKTHIRYEPPKPSNSLPLNPKKQQSSLVIDTLLNGDGMIIAYVYSSTTTLAPGRCSLRALS